MDTGQPYIYASGNPVTYSDPDGLCTVYEQDPESGDWICTFYVGDDTVVHVGSDPLCGSIQGCKFGDEVRFIPPGSPYEKNGTSTLPNPIGAIVDEIVGPLDSFLAELEGGWHEVMDPVTCGLQGFNPMTGQAGNCNHEQVERREAYQEAGEAVCEASRTPVVGTWLPTSVDRSWVAWTITDQWSNVVIQSAREGGMAAAKTVGAAANVASAAATAVDALCRQGP